MLDQGKYQSIKCLGDLKNRLARDILTQLLLLILQEQEYMDDGS
jgi:hypothetical protein